MLVLKSAVYGRGTLQLPRSILCHGHTALRRFLQTLSSRAQAESQRDEDNPRDLHLTVLVILSAGRVALAQRGQIEGPLPRPTDVL
jgi:hypothetical protein